MNPRDCARERRYYWSQQSRLNQKNWAVGTLKRCLAKMAIVIEKLKNSETLERQHLESAVDQPAAAAAAAVVADATAVAAAAAAVAADY